MNKLEQFINKIIFSKKNKEYEKFKESYHYFKEISNEEFTFQHIKIQSTYELKKTYVIAGIITFLISIISGVWKYFFILMKNLLINQSSVHQFSEEQISVVIILSIIMVAMMCLIILLLIVTSLKDLSKSHKLLLIVEKVQQERNQ